MPPWGPKMVPVSLRAEVALQHRLEEVADRGDRGDGGADDQRVHSREPVLVEAGEPEAHGADQEAADQPLDRLVGARSSGAILWLPNMRPVA